MNGVNMIKITVLILVAALILPLVSAQQCLPLPWLGGGSIIQTYYQDIEIDGTFDPSVPFIGALTYIEDSIGELAATFVTTFDDPWDVGEIMTMSSGSMSATSAFDRDPYESGTTQQGTSKSAVKPLHAQTRARADSNAAE